MTLADLGKSAKSLHPKAYDHVADEVLGAALQKRFPGIYDHIKPANMDKGTVPETPKTLKIQLEQLSQGIRRAVFVARGSKLKIRAADYGAKRLPSPAGDFFYDPKAITAREILSALRNHELASILGSADAGYGAPDKTELEGNPVAVVSRDEDGETVQGALSDGPHVDESVSAARQVTPAGGTVSVEPPEHEMANRLESRRKSKLPASLISDSPNSLK